MGRFVPVPSASPSWSDGGAGLGYVKKKLVQGKDASAVRETVLQEQGAQGPRYHTVRRAVCDLLRMLHAWLPPDGKVCAVATTPQPPTGI